VTDKLTQVHDTIWCCRSGSAADTQAVADIVHYYLGMYGITNDEPPSTQTAAALFQEICYDNKDGLRSVQHSAPLGRRPCQNEARNSSLTWCLPPPTAPA
ncbi:MAG: hypothetical protein INR71_09925, partial [Terriglobus roseus]|nr:hypothetical protein [Terriglobus roseus]